MQVAKVLKVCWEILKVEYFAMVCDFWRTSNLAYGIKDGVIKFIPKKTDWNSDKQTLGEWRVNLNNSYNHLEGIG